MKDEVMPLAKKSVAPSGNGMRTSRDLIIDMLTLLRESARYHDTQIICKNGTYQSNSLVLASMFPIFQEALRARTDDEPMFVVSMPDMDISQFHRMFESLYLEQPEILVDAELIRGFGEFRSGHNVFDGDSLDPNTVIDNFVKTEFLNDFDTKMAESAKAEEKIQRLPITKTPVAPVVKKRRKPKTKKKIKNALNTIKFQVEKSEQGIFVNILKDDTNFNAVPGNIFNVNQCVYCDKVVESAAKLSEHIKYHPKDGGHKYPCPICGKKMVKMMMLRHLSVYHLQPDKYQKCPQCPDIIRKGSVQHAKTCKGVKRVVCNYCGKVVTEARLKYHIQSFHSAPQPIAHYCNKCGKGFPTPAGLTKHMKTHDEKEPCPECGVRVRNMSEHIKSAHTPDNQKPFQCQDCGKGFFRAQPLEQHRINIHLKTRPYNCRYGCNISYNDTSNRNSHEKKTHGKLFTTVKEEKLKLRAELYGNGTMQ